MLYNNIIRGDNESMQKLLFRILVLGWLVVVAAMGVGDS